MTLKLSKIAADFKTQLAAKISVGGTTGTLQSNTDDDGVLLADGLYYFTIDGSSSTKEHIQCTKTGTSLSAIKSVSRQGVITSGVAREHRTGAEVKLTDFANLRFLGDLLTGTTDLDASIPLKYDANPTLTDDKHLATKKYIDDVSIAGGAKATDSVYGLSKLSVAAVSPTVPIAVGDNDTRVPTAAQSAAIAGTGTPSGTNKFVTRDTITGIIAMWGAAAAPTGWLLCDGSSVLRATYADLFTVIGTTYGSADGTHFTLPNLKGKVPVGYDAAETEFDALGETGGEKTHTLDTTEIPAHTHTISGALNGTGGLPQITGVVDNPGDINTGSTGGGLAHNNLQPYITLNFIIKT